MRSYEPPDHVVWDWTWEQTLGEGQTSAAFRNAIRNLFLQNAQKPWSHPLVYNYPTQPPHDDGYRKTTASKETAGIHSGMIAHQQPTSITEHLEPTRTSWYQYRRQKSSHNYQDHRINISFFQVPKCKMFASTSSFCAFSVSNTN